MKWIIKSEHNTNKFAIGNKHLKVFILCNVYHQLLYKLVLKYIFVSLISVEVMVPWPGRNASSQELHNFGVGTSAGLEGK